MKYSRFYSSKGFVDKRPDETADVDERKTIRREDSPISPVEQATKADSFVLDIDESDVVSDRSQGDGHNPMDVTGYVVEFKHPHADWAVAETREFQRSELA